MPELRNSQVKNSDENAEKVVENHPSEDASCGKCQGEVTAVDKAVNCEICSHWYHIICVEVTAAKYKFMMNNPDLHWFCGQCDTAAKKLHQEVIHIKSENSQLRECVSQLQEKLQQVMETVEKDRLDFIIANDRNESYSRKDSLRISGIPHEANETNSELEAKIINIASMAKVQLKREDISVTHCLKKDRKGKFPTIVKFSTRRAKDLLYMAKKNLKEVKEMEEVFISEDLTHLRFRTLLQAKKAVNFRSVATKGGKIFVWLIGSDKPILVESPYDLRRLNIEPDWEFLGIQRK